MRNHITLITLLSFAMSASTGHAVDNCISTVDMSKLRTAIGEHSEFYGDLPNRINCLKPIKNQKMVCENEVLRFMERLDHMAGVYAYENANKTELDHRKPYGVKGLNKMLNKCDDTECICANFKEWADASLGGTSPYTSD